MVKDKKKWFKVGLFNAGSLGTRHDEFVAALLCLSLDILAINETWMRQGQDDKAPVVPGYKLRHSPRPVSVRGGRGGGVGFYIRQGLNVRTYQHPASNAVEQMWLGTTVNRRRLIIGTAYRPPWLDVNEFFDAITQSVASFGYADCVVLLGDFNINLLKIDDNKTKLFQEFLHCTNLTQLVKKPTHFTDHSSTLIDVICTDSCVQNVEVTHIPELGNHAIVSSTLNLKKDKDLPSWIIIRPLKNVIVENFTKDLNSISWNFVNSVSDVNDIVVEFNRIIIDLFNVHAPLRKIMLKEQHPWITNVVKLMIKLRNESHVRAKTTGILTHKMYYKDMKQLVKRALESEKKASH